jgi:two-component system, NarL family, sensor kinase
LSVPSEFGRLNYDLEIANFRIVQEALANIHRHSGSPAAVIDLQRLPNHVVLMVQDWGCGLRSPSVGVGLAGMRERAKPLGGRFNTLNRRPSLCDAEECR